jgi:ligand-binding sensor domain-containing protein
MLRSLFSVFGLFATLLLSAQQYNFRNYSVADGLAQSQVYTICEDTRGYLWMGTRGGGISRFDGTQFVNYTEDHGLVNNYVLCITTDKRGDIWIGTDEGLSKFDGIRFEEIKLPGSRHKIRSVICGDDGKTWIGTEDTGLFVMENGKFSLYREGKVLPSKRINTLFKDSDGSIWAGTPLGVVHFLNGGGTKLYGKKEGLVFTDSWGIARDGNKQLWIATYGGGLFRLAKDGKLLRFTQDNGLTNNTVHCLTTDGAGRLWAGTASGVTRIAGKEVVNFTEREGLCSNVVMCITIDSWGNLWFGTSGGGVCRLDGERFIHFTEKSGDMGAWVYDVHCDRNGHMWFASSRGGVTEYDGTYYTNYYEGAGFTSAKVKCIGEDTSGRMWFGTSGEGAYSFKDGSFRHYTRSDGLSSNHFYCFLTDSMNRTWMGTAGGYITIYDPKDESFMKVGKKDGLTNDRIYSMCMDTKGNIWVGSGNGAFLMHYDSAGTRVKKAFHESEGLAGNFVRSVTCDKNDAIWFGTAGGGLSRYKRGQFTNYTNKDGIASNNVYSLIADKSNNIWVGTERGLDKVALKADGTISTIKHYGKGEGLRGIETSQNAACLDTASGVWFGTINGASVYHPEFDKVNKEPPKVHITGIRLFFDPIESTPYGSAAEGYKWFPVPDQLELPYTENHLRFEFSGIDLKNPDGVRYRWRLSDFETEWTPENSERIATYSNLQPGEYTFEVQGKNSDGYWSDIQKFTFRITPPYYATWTFRIAAVVIILLLLTLIFRWRLKRAQRRTKEQLDKVKLEKNLLELEQKALRLQMNPHFIFNALQSINGYIAMNDSAEARKYLAKFGKLMRMTLENSRNSYTTIEQEAELLYNYTALEAMSQGNRFTTHIEIDERINHESTFIPVMLIQPFVENAIIHGLKHKLEGGGELYIRFIIEGETDDKRCIVCEIEDNGVGRKKAAEYEAGIRKDHKSAALDITRERLKQMNLPTGQAGEEGKPVSSMEIIDLTDSNGEGCGTRVVIRIGNVIFE